MPSSDDLDLAPCLRSEDRRMLDQIAALLGHLATLPRFPELSPLEVALEMNRIVPLDKAAHLRGVSQDTLVLHDGNKIVDLSPRRKGMRVKDALLL
jgi:hypothetical protein